ncbi:uncharacterized protein LOC115685634 [Syzygium oleosum]|uniref:uncharacterized protein LOC115685634 n=1 Tax=Syzygium oleosum TaxID=219896 RepID=UPI0024B90C01|nr:uncharacterized protein LOC115685634 [Syzygium oleosum]
MADPKQLLQQPTSMSIRKGKSNVANLLTLVAGDFNAIRDHSDRLGSFTSWIPAFDELASCLYQAGLDDLKYVGHRYTWSTSAGTYRKQRKIDRVLINDQWSRTFSFSDATFLAPGVSDHTSMVIRVELSSSGKKPFKFFNCWVSHLSFRTTVTQAWDSHISGTPMFILCCKLKALKGRLKILNRESFSDISGRTARARAELTETQEALANNPSSLSLANLEKIQLQAFSELRIQEELFYK